MKNQKTKYLTNLAFLSAVVLVMAFTPLGQFKTPMLNVSFLCVPVAIGAMTLGPLAGAVLGAIFGLTSFFQAFTDGGMKSVLLGINPWACFIVTVVARILCGLLCGLIYKALTKNEKKNSSRIIGSLSCPFFNTVFFMGFIMLFYYNTDYIQGFAEKLGTNGPIALILAMVGVQGAIEMIVCCIIATAVSKALDHMN